MTHARAATTAPSLRPPVAVALLAALVLVLMVLAAITAAAAPTASAGASWNKGKPSGASWNTVDRGHGASWN